MCSNKILYHILPTPFHLTLFTESFLWDLGLLCTSRVHGICWNNKSCKKGLNIYRRNKRRERCEYIWGFFTLAWQSLQLKTAVSSCFCDLPQHRPACTHVIREQLCFLGRRVYADVVSWGMWEWGCRYQTRDGVKSKHTRFYNREIQLAEGWGSKSRLKNIYSLLLQYHQLRECSAGGEVSAKDF